MNFDIYASVWNKYLPIIRILFKKSLTSDQQLVLNVPDFQRAGMTRKSGYKFHAIIKNGRPGNVMVDLPFASALVSVLLQDDVIRELSSEAEFHVLLNTSFQLTIRHIAPAKVEETLVAETLTA